MKKIIVFLVFTLLLTSCFSNKESNETQNWTGAAVETSTGKTIPEEEKEVIKDDKDKEQTFEEVNNHSNNIFINDEWKVFVYELFKDYELKWDLLTFDMFFEKNIDFFKKQWETIFYDIWSDNIYGTNKTEWTFAQLSQCFETGDTSNLDSFLSSICKWKNKYDSKNDVNPAFTKANLVEFKKAYKNKDYDCGALLKKNYDFSEDRKYYAMKEFYLICKKFQDPDKVSLKDLSYQLYSSKATEACNQLKDKNLSKLCNDEPNKDPQ